MSPNSTFDGKSVFPASLLTGLMISDRSARNLGLESKFRHVAGAHKPHPYCT